MWGLLPCGLLYSVVAAAVLLADPLATTALVISFGLGTIPLLLGAGLATLKFRSAINRRGLRWLAATLLALTGLLIAAGPWLAHTLNHPWMQFLGRLRGVASKGQKANKKFCKPPKTPNAPECS